MVRITFLSVKVRKEVGGPETQKKHGNAACEKTHTTRENCDTWWDVLIVAMWWILPILTT